MPSILIVSHGFPPDYTVGAKRALRMATHLAGLGWIVRVLTVKESYFEDLDPTLLKPEAPFEVIRTHALVPKLWLRRLLSGGRNAHGGKAAATVGSNGSRAAKRVLRALASGWDALFALPDDLAGWLPMAIAGGLSRARDVDLILATIPPNTSALVGTLLAARHRVPLVLDFRDPWMPVPGEAQPPRWRMRIDRALERYCTTRASLIVTTTRGLQRSLVESGAPRTVVVPNGFNPALMSEIVPTRYDRFTMVYAGKLSGLRSAEPVLDAIGILRESGHLPESGIALRILGSSGRDVAALAESRGFRDVVEVENFLPYREALSRIKGADVLLLVVAEAHFNLIPAKLFDYVAARRFILAVTPTGSDAGALISELGAGIAIDPREVKEIARVLRERFAHRGATQPLLASASRYEDRVTMVELDRHLRAVLGRA